MAQAKDETPTFAGKPLELQPDGSGWKLQVGRVEVLASRSLAYGSWQARIRVDGREVGKADFGSTAQEAVREAESSMRQLVHLMNSAVSL